MQKKYLLIIGIVSLLLVGILLLSNRETIFNSLELSSTNLNSVLSYALQLSNTSGFVTSAPATDPSGNSYNFGSNSNALRVVSPAGATSISQIGAWLEVTDAGVDWQVGIYSHDSVNNEPEELLASGVGTTLSGSNWNYANVDYAITGETIYWIAIQIDDSSTRAVGNYDSLAGQYWRVKTSSTALPSNWGTSDNQNNGYIIGLYALLSSGDTIYPTFSNYYDNNGTKLDYGLATFNVTMNNTNGTVLLEINNTNYTATNLTSNVYNVSINLVNKTYSYKWHSWGNGSSANYNKSEIRSYTINATDITPPSVVFVNQDPQDLNLSNFLGSSGVNITYNISDESGINLSRTRLYYKSNSTTSNVMYYENGTNYSGYFNKNGFINISSNFTWNLLDNNVLPASYNYLESRMEIENKSQTAITGANDYVSVELLNITNNTNYGFYEVMVNSTSASLALRFYYCNSSFAFTNSPAGNSNCVQFYTLMNGTFNHIHTNQSGHQVIPFSVNKTTGKIAGIDVTSISYFIMRGQTGTSWNYFYTLNNSRAGSMKTSSNNGLAWTTRTYTIDAHIHQYEVNSTGAITNSLWYYACANDTLNNENCSSLRQDLFEAKGLPPDGVNVYAPNTSNYYVKNISINYTEGISPNGYTISYYNISLANVDLSYNKTIYTNNSVNLSYIWDRTGTLDGNYTIRVEVCDNLQQCSDTFSEEFQLLTDTIYPIFSNYYDNNGTVNGSGYAIFNVTVTNTNGTVWLEINNTNYTATNLTNSVYNVTLFLVNRTYYYIWHAFGNGIMENYNSSGTRSYTLNDTLVDDMYPIFSNYWDNNGTLNGTGYAQFNVTLLNTNGTVWLEINGNNYTSTNMTNAVYNRTVFLSNGTYSYRWISWGNGTDNLFNKSILRSYTLNNTFDVTPPTWVNLRNFSHTVNTGFSNSITATDTSGIGTYLLNDTTYFTINSATGSIQNATNLSRIEIHWLNISVNDTAGNLLSGVFYININVSTPSTGELTVAKCKYKQLGYYNTKLVWIRDESCL